MTEFSMVKYEVVIFDLDSTITNTQRYPMQVAKWLIGQLTDRPEDYQTPYIRSLVSHYFALIRSVSSGDTYISPSEVFRSSMEHSLADIGLEAASDILNEATVRMKRLHFEIATIYPDAQRFIDILLKKGIRLGVVTNSFEGNAERILEKLGLHDAFSCVVDGGIVNTFKPNPKVFEHALVSLDGDIITSLFIGDEYFADIVGASRYGMDTVWLNRRRRTLDEVMAQYNAAIIPTVTIESLDELLPL